MKPESRFFLFKSIPRAFSNMTFSFYIPRGGWPRSPACERYDTTHGIVDFFGVCALSASSRLLLGASGAIARGAGVIGGAPRRTRIGTAARPVLRAAFRAVAMSSPSLNAGLGGAPGVVLGNPPPRAVDSRGRPVIIITIIIPSRTRRDCGVGSRTTPSTSPPPRCATAPRRARPRPRPPGSIPRSGAVSASRARSTTRDRDRPRGVSSRRARGARLPRAAAATLAAAAPRGGPRFPRGPRFRPAPRVRRSRVASHAPRVTGAPPRAPPNPLARHPPEEASISPISPTRGSRRG